MDRIECFDVYFPTGELTVNWNTNELIAFISGYIWDPPQKIVKWRAHIGK